MQPPIQTRMLAKTFFGFEEILKKELLDLGAKDITVQNRIVKFYGDLGFLYKANFSLFTALRILVPLTEFRAKNEEHFYRNLKKIKWESFIENHQTFRVDAVINSSFFNHSHYIELKTKDAIVDYFREKFDTRLNISKKGADIVFHVHIEEDRVEISLDSSGESLHKRGYKVVQHKAPISEVLAAGLLKLADWDGKTNLLDPMCGSGTILIEAAMMAANIPPQIHRKKFAFENWQNFDEELFIKIKETRLNRIKEFSGKIYGYDSNKNAVLDAQENVEACNLGEFITITNQDFFDSKKEVSPLKIIFNPPYDERLQVNNDELYQNIGDCLKKNYPNVDAWFITSDIEAHKKIGLRPSRKIRLFNGKLECKFYKFELYEGTKKHRE